MSLFLAYLALASIASAIAVRGRDAAVCVAIMWVAIAYLVAGHA